MGKTASFVTPACKVKTANLQRYVGACSVYYNIHMYCCYFDGLAGPQAHMVPVNRAEPVSRTLGASVGSNAQEHSRLPTLHMMHCTHKRTQPYVRICT